MVKNLFQKSWKEMKILKYQNIAILVTFFTFKIKHQAETWNCLHLFSKPKSQVWKPEDPGSDTSSATAKDVIWVSVCSDLNFPSCNMRYLD